MLTLASTREEIPSAAVIPLGDENPTRRRAWVTIILILVNVGVYFLVQPGSAEVDATAEFHYRNAAIPCELRTREPLSEDEIRGALLGHELCEEDDTSAEVFPGKRVLLAALVSMFLHGSILHLAGNMLFLWIFGNNIEDRLGPLLYIAFYVASGVVATIAHVAVQPDSTIPVVGASGAIAGVMGAYLVWFPNAPVRTVLLLGFFVLFPQIRAKWLLGFWFVSQFFVNPNEGVAWMAHVGGFVFGALAGLLLAAVRPRPSPAPRW
jgi:membrane associated rhomboid family serine protease